MRIIYLLILGLGMSFPSYSQEVFTAESQGYYTIVGAFAIKENATKYNTSLNKSGLKTACNYLPSRNIYYVWTLRNAEAKPCLDAMRELRKKPEFWDAWVRYINADGVDSAPVADAPTNETSTPTNPEPSVSRSISVAEQAANETTALPTESAGEEVAQTEKLIIPDKVTLGNTEIFLSLYDPNKDKVANGVVQVIDTERGRLIQEVPGNTYLILPDPKNKEGKMTLTADVLGYRKVQKEINYNNPLADTSFITDMGTSIIANFEMVRYHKGDIRTLYNIYFFNDAAVMMPESKFELNQLLDMLKENNNYLIKLHGHTNGNYHGKIIRVGDGGDFFSVAKDAKTTVGSAKELSESRAGVIKDWLVANGIDASRIEVKAWGGKRPLYDKHSANAKKNIRVEVEVLDE